MNLTIEHIPNIEKVLNVKFTDEQIDFLLSNKEPFHEMTTGSDDEKRLAYSVRILFSNGKLLNLNHPHQFSDRWDLNDDDKKVYARKVFRSEFISIWAKLHDARAKYNFTLRNIFI